MTSSMDHNPFLWLIVVWICCTFQSTQQFESDHHHIMSDVQVNLTTVSTQGRVKRLLITDKARHWPNFIVPYKFIRVDEKNGRDIIGSMAFYEYWTPLRFQTWNKDLAKKLGHPGFIKYATTYGRGWSLLGFYNSKNGQWIDCPHLATCVHELGHALGFQHEQYHPEREKWIRVNKQNLHELDTWRKSGWEEYKHYSFDLSSTMLYGPTRAEFYDILFPDLQFETRYFYLFKEFCDVYECHKRPQCKNHRLTCVNEGFVSVVQDKCACICPRGLDPDSMCKDVVKKGPPEWPMGSYSLLSHKDGCPQGSFSTGLWTHFGTGENRKQSDTFKGDFSDTKAEFSFCTKASESSARNDFWPPGAYCFFKRGAKCPQEKGMHSGKITIPGRSDTSRNRNSRALPSGSYNQDTTLEFCCVQDGFTELPMSLPSEKPFILFRMDDKDCQQVAGMHVKAEKLGLWGAKMQGLIKYSKEGSRMHISYCVYTPLKRDCGAVIEMGPNKRSFTIESDRINPENMECHWIFNSPNQKDSLVLSFDELSIQPSEAACDNNVEVQPTRIGQKGLVFCGDEKDKSVQSLFGKIRVQFKNGNSRSYFKATVKWIPEKEMCYNPQDNGWSYRGKVNFTRKFEPCVPWSEASSCLHNPLHIGDLDAGLEENYCRNPDDGYRPWCFTRLDGCKRNFCDVCHLETPYDHMDNCADHKKAGQCTASDVDCAKTCDLVKPVKKGSEVHCKSPGTISGGVIQGSTKQRYDLGEKVTFKCTKSGNTIERTCLSTGEWTAANTACLPCPDGYHHYRYNCYKFHFEFMNFADATKECKKHGDVLALPRSEEETEFFGMIKFRFNEIWLGAKIDKQNVYRDIEGNPVTWFRWRYHDIPHVEPCMTLTVKNLWVSIVWCEQWKFNFICQRPVNDDNPDCKDFLDNCPTLVSSVNGSICENLPGLDTYCRYSCGLCPRDCDRVIRLNQTSPRYTISADRRRESHRFCTWTIKAPNKNGRLVIHFDEFQVKSGVDECVDSVEVREKEYGAPYIRYCNTNYTKTMVMVNDEMLVRFRTPGVSSSHFKATVEWIPDSDMCYSTKDKGWSYNGNVFYTENFQPCLPWDKALDCGNNTLQNGYFLDNLDHNYCRNHDNSERPWCYSDDCHKQYCDVCHLELPSDTSSDCQKFKTDGKCVTDQSRAVTECAETCQEKIQSTNTKVSAITCPRPSAVPQGTLTSSVKRSYSVGEKVKYRCTKSQQSIERTCMTSGGWSPANTACLECPHGYLPFQAKCYKYYDRYEDKAGAQGVCQGDGAVIATPKDKEQNAFVSLLRRQERIWLGAKKGSDEFLWNDGIGVTWTNWQKPKKKFASRDDCMILEKDGRRTDDWCEMKLFHFVCQTERRPDQAECVDYLDNCPALLQSVPESNCFAYPSLQLYCRASCGMCTKGCGEQVQMTSSQEHSIVANAKSGHSFCLWDFQGDATKGRFIFALDEFILDTHDNLILKETPFSDAVQQFTKSSYKSITQVYNNKLFITFKTSANSGSHFKATVKWVKDSDMCYNVGDKGRSYNGHVNYTKQFNPCRPWSDVLTCPHNPLKASDFLANLEGAYCRNPDPNERGRPWCYDNRCQVQECDVCHLEPPRDRYRDCDKRKANGVCSTKDSVGCAKTCQIDQEQSHVKVSDVKCSRPGAVSGGTIQGPTKSSYSVGEKVVYTCTKSSFPIERVCLSSGKWTDANTACLVCPMDFVYFKGMCYRVMNLKLNYTDAVEQCDRLGSQIAAPKTKEQNDFLNSFGFKKNSRRERIWLGAQKNITEGNYIWMDGTPVTWNSFGRREPFKERDNCIYLEQSLWWSDDWCEKYYNFVCQQKAYDEPECKDFLDSCPHLLSLTKTGTCGSNYRMNTLCRKTCNLCSEGCNHEVQLSQSNPSTVISSDRRTDPDTHCAWKIKGVSNHGRFIMQFEEFDVESSRNRGKKCASVVEVSRTKHDTPERFCNGKSKPYMEIVNHEMFVHFMTTASSKSHFKAQIQWIDDSSMCYNVQDKGRSYNGQVNHTESFKPCMAWSDALMCDHHPLKGEDFLDNLDGNYCRNPDDNERPWCYVSNCQKDFCDVCHLEKPVDTGKYCADFKARGYCETRPKPALQDCAATCQQVSTDPVPKVTEVSCGPPGSISGAAMEGAHKSRYGVGDQVTYKCARGDSVVRRTCLTSGDWSVARTACLECPLGWDNHEGKCYQYVDQFIEYSDAVYICKQKGAIVATYKSANMGPFLKGYCPDSDYIWVGMQKDPISKKYRWSDGDLVTWFPEWTDKVKSMEDRDDCVKMEYESIRDDWCDRKYYSFVCEKDSNDKPDCIDFLHTCPQLLAMKKDHKCDNVLNNFCRKTCSKCTIGG